MMISLIHILELFDATIGNQHFLFIATVATLTLKSFIFYFLCTRTNNNAAKRAKIFLIFMLLSAMISDFSWVVALANQLFFQNFDYRIRIFVIRIAWGFQAILFMTIAFFTEALIATHRKRNWFQIINLIIYSLYSLAFFIVAFIHFNCVKATDRSLFEDYLQQSFKVCFLILLLATIIINIKKIRSIALPTILKHQLKIFISGIVFPFWLTELFQVWPLENFIPTNSYAAANISTLLTTIAIYFSTRKFIGLRFLNFRNHVESTTRFNFIDEFKIVLERLSQATSIQELQHLTQTSFKDMFGLPISRAKLYMLYDKEDLQQSYHVEHTVENFLAIQPEIVQLYVHNNRILIYDEIAFNNFYDKSEEGNKALRFLDAINADIFIPVHAKQKLLAYIVVERFARPDKLYSNIEHDEMAVYANYLGNIINLLQTRNIEQLMQRERDLHEELYSKHQEINQYKESIHSFLRKSNQKEIGIIFYKSRRFSFGNQTAQELIGINLNQQQGHPLAQKMYHLVRMAQEYKSPQSCFAKDKNGNKLILSAVPHLDHSSVIITVHYPDVADLIKKQIDCLKDPTKWDYLLYLETTQSGKLINQLIPGNGEHLLNFKINLLQAALSRKAILLDMPEDDLMPTVQLLNHISLREELYTLKLTHPTKGSDIAPKLFGLNPLFEQQTERALLEKLDPLGTIFIQNVHFLDLETQNYLAEYLMYGFFRIYKSDKRVPSSVRIICSSNKNIALLVKEGSFSTQLFNQLNNHTLALPSLLTITEGEMHELADGYTEQALKDEDFKNFLELTHKERSRLITHRPVSLQELKERTHQILIHKSKEHQMYNEHTFDKAYEISDPELIEAARLGKNALRDERIMNLLWHKFKSQSKIASFLNVNRSSVNRRCRAYNLIEE
jgi:transcriptional regulator with GAF, ATPase, and Fis domain